MTLKDPNRLLFHGFCAAQAFCESCNIEQTALTNLGLTGVDPFTLQRAAGHANITTTRKYVHPTPPTMKDAFQKKEESPE